jgi:hypothetical protein
MYADATVSVIQADGREHRRTHCQVHTDMSYRTSNGLSSRVNRSPWSIVSSRPRSFRVARGRIG